MFVRDFRARHPGAMRGLTPQNRGHQKRYLIFFRGLWQSTEWIMSLVHRDLQTFRTPPVLWQQQRNLSANCLRALIFGTLVVATLNSSWAQDAGVVTTGKPNPLYPEESLITFQWNYACPENRPCTFVCRGAGGGGGSDHVTPLDIYLGTLPLNGVQQERAAAIFYDFSSREFPNSAGFAISTGINSLSCQVNGMILKYSGPPAKKSKPDSLEDTPMSRLDQ
jgi:hypothetical protein